MRPNSPLQNVRRSPLWLLAAVAVFALVLTCSTTFYATRRTLKPASAPAPASSGPKAAAHRAPNSEPTQQPRLPAAPVVTDPELAAGRCLMIGIPREWSPGNPFPLDRVAAGSVILYKHNIPSSAERLRRLCDAIRAYESEKWGFEPVIAIDHEGGSITRLGAIKQVTVFPSNWDLGEADDALRRVSQEGQTMGDELGGLGIDLDLAPVVDVLEQPGETHIGVRSYGPEPGLVGVLGAGFIEAMRRTGLRTCAKHWPGYGRLGKDPHKYVAQGHVSRDEWLAKYVPPFKRAVAAGVDSVMSGHIIYDFFDRDKPASVVPAVYQELRERTGFQGPILTDDMEMKSAIDLYDGNFGRLALDAKKAGADMVLVCWTAAYAIESRDAIANAIRNGLDVSQSLARIQMLRRKR